MKHLLIVAALVLGTPGCYEPPPRGPDLRCVVRLSVYVQGEGFQWRGSGVVVGRNVVLTARHCADDPTEQLWVEVWDGERWGDYYPVIEWEVHPDQYDIAVLRVGTLPEWVVCAQMSTSDASLYDEVVTVGATVHGVPMPVFGHVGGFLDNAILGSAPLVPGFSGGPLFRLGGDEWRVLGINSFATIAGYQLAYHLAGYSPCPTDWIATCLQRYLPLAVTDSPAPALKSETSTG